MVYRTTLYIAPMNLPDLTVVNETTEETMILIGGEDYDECDLVYLADSDIITISATGYRTITNTAEYFYDNPYVNLEQILEVANLSDGVNTYQIKDAVARAMITTAADGQWVNSAVTLAQDESYSSQEAKTYSLSNYLPNDGRTYEVLFAIAVMTANTSGALADVGIETDVIYGTACRVCSVKARVAYAAYASGTVIMPVGAGRSVKLFQYDNSSMQVRFLRGIAYRRLGTNS